MFNSTLMIYSNILVIHYKQDKTFNLNLVG